MTADIKLVPSSETIMRPEQRRIDVAPHGWVQYLDHMGTDETIVAAARTSSGKGFISWEPYIRCEKCGQWGSMESARTLGLSSRYDGVCRFGGSHDLKEFPRGDNGILEYMYKNRHETPAEMPVIRTLWKAPISVFRQVHRHRAASYNEQSARYMQLPSDFYAPRPEEVKGQSRTNKQGSDGGLPEDLQREFITDLTVEQQRAYNFYDRWTERGVAPETSRFFLQNTIYSVCMIQMNLRMDLHLLGLRDDSHAQGITQEYARAQAAFTKALYPKWYALYEEYTKFAVRLSRTEAKNVRELLMELRDLGPGASLTAEAEALYKRLTS